MLYLSVREVTESERQRSVLLQRSVCAHIPTMTEVLWSDTPRVIFDRVANLKVHKELE